MLKVYYKLKALGPGLLFAGAAIGVSHLVQSTKAGANFGLGLLWALLLVNICKYPFFQFGPRYAAATGESLVEGYAKLGKPILGVYFILNFATMFTIQAAVTIVTAGIATTLFGDFGVLSIGRFSIASIQIWTAIILAISLFILVIGKYTLLDRLIKIIIITLTISTIIAVFFAYTGHNRVLSFKQILPKNSLDIAFLIAFMGWMPAPLDVAVWHSIWSVEKKKDNSNILASKTALFDFNIGYIGTIVLGIGFLLLGTFVMYNTGETFSKSAGLFANQLINMYTKNLGSWAYLIIGIAAFTTMLSTTLTSLDASPRIMSKIVQLSFKSQRLSSYKFWIILLAVGSLLIFLFLASEMGLLIKIATILSFLTAPFYAIINYKLINSEHTPKSWHPSTQLKALSWLGILFLIGFSIWFLTTL